MVFTKGFFSTHFLSNVLPKTLKWWFVNRSGLLGRIAMKEPGANAGQ